MLNQQLLDYIRQSLAMGTKKEDIKASLLSIGWQGSDIDEAMKSFNTGHEGFSIPAQKIEPATKKNISLVAKILIVAILGAVILVAVGGYLALYN